MSEELSVLSVEQLLTRAYELRQLRDTLSETMRASDACETWGYYGRASSEQMPTVRRDIYEVDQELRRRGFGV